LTFRSTQELSWQPFSVGWWLCRHHECCSLLAFRQPHVIASMLSLLLSIHLKLVTVVDYS